MPRLNLIFKKMGTAARSLPQQDAESSTALSPGGQALLEEVDQLAEAVLAPEKVAHETMSQKAAMNIRKTAAALYAVTVVFSLLLSVALLLNAFAANGVLGMRFFVEPTNAMPQAPYGSLLITVTRPSSRINRGDIITYYALPGDSNSRLTRIVDERQESNGIPIFRTKRAGNAAPDSMLINMTHILGVKLAVIPYAGHVISFTQTYAWGIAVLAGALAVSAVVLRMWAHLEHPEVKQLLKLKKKKKTRKTRKGHVLNANG